MNTAKACYCTGPAPGEKLCPCQKQFEAEHAKNWMTCNHCYCLQVHGHGSGTNPHNKCCKCGDVMAAHGRVTF